jgi:TolB-like protein/Tfp pilus assembly protein PilF
MRQNVSFDPFSFDSATGRLWCGAQEVSLTPKAAAVLETLVANAGEPVSKQELFASVWRDRVVSDDALISVIQELRKALADDPKQPRFIETRHRRGYRFVARISQPGSSVANREHTSRRATDHGGRPTIAVLPFENISGDPAREYFSDAITQDIITALSRHRSLLVVARGSSFVFRGSGINPSRVGLDLGAGYIVEGSVGKLGTRVRISARLVETESGRYVWAEQYDREFEDIFEVQDEIAATIAARIEPEVGGAERSRAARKSESALRAWDCFHLGMAHFYKPAAAENAAAQRFFRRAIELDPTFAQAHAWLSYAQVMGMIYFETEPDAERLDQAVAIARKGVELDEQDAMTHFMCGRALLARKDYLDAIAELEVAFALNPNLPVVYCGLGDSLAYEGRFSEAIPYFEKAIQLSPFDPQRWAFYSYRALAHLLAAEFDQAADWAHKASRIPNSHYWPLAHRVSALGHLQRTEEFAGTSLLHQESRASRALCSGTAPCGNRGVKIRNSS